MSCHRGWITQSTFSPRPDEYQMVTGRNALRGRRRKPERRDCVNVFEKLQTAKVRLQGKNLKKTGKNVFSKYDYFELGDFQPTVNSIFLELKLFSYVSFTRELATLTVINIEKPDEVVVVTSPMEDADLKGCHPIQNLGAVETYQRRYLYMAALDMVESDAIDAGQAELSKTKKRDFKQEYVDKAAETGFDLEDLQILAEETAKFQLKKETKWKDIPDNVFNTLMKQLESDEKIAGARALVTKIKEGQKDGVA